MAPKKSTRKNSRRSPQKQCKYKKSKHGRRRSANTKRYDSRLEFGLQYIRGGASLAKAARKIGVTPARLRTYVAATGVVTRRNGQWHFKRDRRFRRMPLYSDGRRVIITVHNGKTTSQIGSYMRAVRMFFNTEDIHHLDPFRDQSVPDINGKRYAFETRPNVLLRLDASAIEPFELVYEIIKPE